MEDSPASNPDVPAETTVDSTPKRSPDIPPDPHVVNRAMMEHYIQKRSIDYWAGPKYLAYNSLASRLRTFNNKWPQGKKPSPASLSEAGFFYDGELQIYIFSFPIRGPITCEKLTSNYFPNYRLDRYYDLFSLWLLSAGLVRDGRSVGRTCTLVPLLRLPQAHQGAYIHSRDTTGEVGL